MNIFNWLMANLDEYSWIVQPEAQPILNEVMHRSSGVEDEKLIQEEK